MADQIKDFKFNDVIKKKKKIKKEVSFSYKNVRFYTLEDVYTFFLKNEKNKEKYASSLLHNKKFLKFMKSFDEDKYNDWAKHILKK